MPSFQVSRNAAICSCSRLTPSAHLLLDVDRHRIHSERRRILRILAAPDQLRIEVRIRGYSRGLAASSSCRIRPEVSAVGMFSRVTSSGWRRVSTEVSVRGWRARVFLRHLHLHIKVPAEGEATVSWPPACSAAPRSRAPGAEVAGAVGYRAGQSDPVIAGSHRSSGRPPRMKPRLFPIVTAAGAGHRVL